MLAVMAASVLFLCGCDADRGHGEGTITPDPAEAVSAQITDAAKTDAPVSETEAAATETAAPSPTPGPEASPVFPMNENNIGSGSAAAAGYIEALAEPEKIILTAEEIAASNSRMTAECAALEDILSIPGSIDGETLRNMITGVSVPELPLYDAEGKDIDEAGLAGIIANAGTDAIAAENPVLLGIIVRRSDLKRFATALEFHSSKGSNVDKIQDTELYMGMPVWVLWKSSDGEFVFVRSYYYSGWTKAENVAIAKDAEEWLKYADPQEFVVVTDAKLTVCGEQADMGVKLPYAGIDADGLNFSVKKPVRNSDGSLGEEETKLSVYSAHKGYLAYTYANFITQAFKYEGTEYQWGGLKGGIDCSSFVASVLRPFGIYIPRDTKDQNCTAGIGADITGLSGNEIRDLIVSEGASAPVAIYLKGHVRLYLGQKDGVFMTIHAPGSNKVVVAEPFDNFGAVISVRTIKL